MSSGPNVIDSNTLRARLKECRDTVDPVVAEYASRVGLQSPQTSRGSLTLTSPERLRMTVATSPGRFRFSPGEGFVNDDPEKTVTAKSFEATARQFPEPELPEPEPPDYSWRIEEVDKSRKRSGSREA